DGWANGATTIKTFTNSGTIIGGSNAFSIQVGKYNQGGATIETFDNQGIIGNGTSRFGIVVLGKNNDKSTINNFNNSGTIHSNDEAIYLNNANVSTFKNEGTISSNNSYGINIDSEAAINNFTNSGVINGNSSGIFVASNIKTLINSGTIIGTNNASSNAGIKLESGGTIDNIINSGTINSNNSGISVTHGKFGTLTIKDGGIVRGKRAGINVGQWQTLGDLNIDGGKSSKKDGTVSGVYGDLYGISLEYYSNTSKIELKNGGVIKGDVSGIRLISGASLSGEMILSGEGSRVEGGSDAGISNESGKITGSIKVENGATVTSSSGQAISNFGSGTITGGITVSGSNTKLEGNIVNTGNASIG
ncbi:TPA: hypothetical protein RZK34_001737, partial [Campylobacter jejuni]|nr:hypothetical protein [Campylobacter jejuni]HEB9330596.1 hypothetical protein [Campylobacter jejuni]